MNLARLLFKPKWQDKNPEVRRAAVTGDNDAELRAMLPQIARNDLDAGVRLAALKRLNEYEAWRERSTGDSDGGIRKLARAAYLTQLCANNAAGPELPRRIAELDTLSGDEMEKVAIQASERDLRAAALARVTRPALLAERAVVDADAQLRAAALERVSDVAALERIAERARKTDKAISRRARELVDAQRIGSGDVDAIASKARALCERMEMLMRTPVAAHDMQHESIDREWQTLGTNLPADVQTRYRGAQALVRQMRANALNPKPAAVQAASETEAVESDSSMAPLAIANSSGTSAADAARPALISVELLASQARFDAALANAAAESQREREQRRANLRELEELTARYTATLDAGSISAAHALHDRVLTLSALIGTLPAPLELRLAPARAQYAELKQQQLWANRQRRETLCESIEQLAQSGLHPDALATRVREARDEWQRLDASEGTTGESGLGRRFQSLCYQALKPTKTYFNKRDELRSKQSEAIETLLQTAAGLPEEITDWKALGVLRQQLGEALRSLDAVDPRERTRLGKRLKDAIASIAPRIDAHIESVEKAKQRLIERAAALTQQSDGRSVARDAKDLQQQWTALGNGKRSADQRQWNEFRGAVDAAFGKLDAARNERDAQTAAARAQVQGLIDEIEALQADTAPSSDIVKAKLRDLDARWQTQRSDDRSSEQRYRNAHEAIAAHQQNAARLKRLSRYTSAMEKYTLLRSLETGAQTSDAVAAQWQTPPALAAEFAVPLGARYAQACAGARSEETGEAQAREQLIELEFLAGVETPTQDRQLRMNYQVQRLASRMRDRAATTPETELTSAIAAWFAQAPQTDDLEARFMLAAQAGITALP